MKLALNGINCGALMISTTEPKETTRAIGDTSEAADGQTTTTRLTKKKDLAFSSVPLSYAKAHAWQSLISGEGEAWSFDSNLYGSKGTGPSAATGATRQAGGAKFGPGKLRLAATTGSITYQSVTLNEFGASVGWHVMFWRLFSAVWSHYQLRSDGVAWVNGVVDPMGAFAIPNLTVSTDVTLANASGSALDFDDLVVLPFAVLDDWPAQIYAAAVAYGPVPYMKATGDLVNEQTTRLVLGRVETAGVMHTSAVDLKTLSVELVAK